MFTLCDKLIQKNKFKPHKKLVGYYTFTCYDEIKNVPLDDWNEAVNGKNAFLSYSYLSIIDRQKTEAFRFRYVLVYFHKKPIGVVYFQINDFSASLFGDLIAHQITELQSKRASVFQKYIQQNENETILEPLCPIFPSKTCPSLGHRPCANALSATIVPCRAS